MADIKRCDLLAELIARKMTGLDLAKLAPEDRAAWLGNAHEAIAVIGKHLVGLSGYEFGQTMKAIMVAGRESVLQTIGGVCPDNKTSPSSGAQEMCALSESPKASLDLLVDNTSEARPEAVPQECGECGRNGDDFATCPRPADVCPAKPFPQAAQPGVQAPVAGLPLAQEPKYTTDGQAVINRSSGEPIPADEPIFVFRARDIHAREALEAYACLLMPGAHRDAVVQRVADFAAFSYAHPDRMKEPDTAPTDAK